MAKQGRPPKLSDEHVTTLKAIVEANPTATMEEIQRELQRRSGLWAHGQTIEKGLRSAGIERRTGGAGVRIQTREAQQARYGYSEADRSQGDEQTYPSCLTDAEWALVADLFECPGARGKPPKYPRRLVVDACCYVVRTGCAWRMLPKAFPPWQNVYATFRRWSAQGRFEQMHDRLRAQWRERERRAQEPTAAVLDSQSTRGSPQGGDNGFDAGKKVKGRKRHLVVDTLGLLLAVSVTAASVQDRDGAHPVMAAAMAKYPGVETVFVDSGYAGRRSADDLPGPRHAGAGRAPSGERECRSLGACRTAGSVHRRGRREGICRAGQALGRGAHPCLDRARTPPGDAPRSPLAGLRSVGLAQRGAAAAETPYSMRNI
jgi:transposase